MTVSYGTLPADSALYSRKNPSDFMDCVQGPRTDFNLTPERAAYVTMAKMPKWVERLMYLRNLLVSPFGLKTGRGRSFGADVPKEFKVGDRIGVFRIESVSDTEVVIGEDDRHLDFRISVFLDETSYYLATWVHPHNWLGRTYLRIVMPFHRLITQNCMKRLVAYQGNQH